VIGIGLVLEEMVRVILADRGEMPFKRGSSIARFELATAPSGAKADVVVESIGPGEFGEWFQIHRRNVENDGILGNRPRENFGDLQGECSPCRLKLMIPWGILLTSLGQARGLKLMIPNLPVGGFC